MIAPHTNDDGFALFEAIVAVTLASLALAGIYRTVGDAVRASEAVSLRRTALELTVSQLELLAADGTVRAGTFAGTYAGGLRWRLTVSPLSERTDVETAQPFWIVLDGLDGQDRLVVRLETAKMAREVR